MSVPTVLIPNPAVHGDYDTRIAGIAALAGAPATLSVKLGRIAPKARPAVPRLAAFLEAPTAAPPAETNWRAKGRESITRMYLNDRYGDCVIAGKYHLVGVWTGNDTPACVTVSDSEVSKVYFHFSPNDQGCNVTEVLDYFRATGLPVNGTPHRIDGYVAVDWRNKLEVQVAIVLFGGLTLAIDLPREWADNPTTWDGPQRNIVGGHDISIVDYNADGVVVSTWGGTRLLTWSALTNLNNNTELYALLAPDWYNSDLLAPNGVKADALKAALQQLGGGSVPPLPEPTPTPPPTPVPPVNDHPVLDVALRGPLGISITGTATPRTSFRAPVAAVSPLAVLEDLYAIYTAYKTGQIQAVVDAVKKLLADLGVLKPTAGALGDGTILKELLALVEQLLPVILPLILKR